MRAFSSTCFDVPTFNLIKPSPPGPKIVPSLRASPASLTNSFLSSDCESFKEEQSSQTKKDASGSIALICGMFFSNNYQQNQHYPEHILASHQASHHTHHKLHG